MDNGMANNRTVVERKSERELAVTRTFDAPIGLVFDAWTKPDLFKAWWAPKSSGVPLLACEMDIRTGGGYSVTFGKDAENSMTFFGKYLEVSPPSRLVWTNDESENGSVTTVTFEEKDGGTLLVLHESYPSKEACDESCAGMEGATPEQFGQLDELLVKLGAGV
jgi:uncharacterized protein YndB with AHSA1/START domain